MFRAAIFAFLFAIHALPIAAEEIPVAPPRVVLGPGYRIDAAMSSDHRTPIAAWREQRIVSSVFAARLRVEKSVLDPYGARIQVPQGFYVNEITAELGGDTMLVAVRLWKVAEEKIAVARMRPDGTRIDDELSVIAPGAHPSIASNGKTFLVASSTRTDVYLTLFSADLEVLARATFPGSSARVTANGDRYLCTFLHDTRLRGLVFEGTVGGEPFTIAGPAYLSSFAATAAGDGWAVATATQTVDVCAVSADRTVSCRTIARPETRSTINEIATTAEGFIVAWQSEVPNGLISLPPPIMLKLHLTRVTRDGEEELETKPGGPESDDDTIMMVGGEAMRIGRKGVVALVPISESSPKQQMYALLPSGDGAMAFWGEVAQSLDAMELHATRFTKDGIDAAVHDRVLGRSVQPLASDGTNVLLSDGRIIDPQARVVSTIPMPAEPTLGGWDGRRWVIVTDKGVHRGEEFLPFLKGYPHHMACHEHGCVMAWLHSTARDPLTMSIEALRIASDLPLKRARRSRIATDIGRQALGVAAAGESLLVAWSDGSARTLRGRMFDARGRLSPPRTIATAVSATDPLYFHTGGSRKNFFLLQNAWPTMRLLRIAPLGEILSTTDLENGSARGVVEIDGRQLVLYDRYAPEPPWNSAVRAFVRFAQ
jgi:hypothetical protein